MATEIGVSTIPVSEVSFPRTILELSDLDRLLQFYCEEHANIGEAYARFSFCKDLDTLRRAAERLQRLKQYIE